MTFCMGLVNYLLIYVRGDNSTFQFVLIMAFYSLSVDWTLFIEMACLEMSRRLVN